ncbi:hypothetical protein ACC785_38305, partial [Rhizobium ruizarguesonis]
ENGDKLAVVDSTALIQRHAFKECGVHIYGPVVREHPFQGLSWQVGEDFSAVEADAVRIDIDHKASEAWPPASRCAAITES